MNSDDGDDKFTYGGVDKLFMNRDTGTAGEITPLYFS